MQTEFTLEPLTGMLAGARQVLSPHWDERPSGMRPELIVVHGISLPPGEFGGPWIDRLFCGNLDPAGHPYFAALAGLKVSAHALVSRDGTVTQYVPCGARAWHAGASSYAGRSACNDFSIGIELEGCDTMPFEPAQYERLAALIVALERRYPIEAVVGHSDIAPGRKTDPGPFFDWKRLDALREQRRASC